LEERAQRKALESELADRAILWLREKWGDRECPYCDHVEWEVGTPVELSTLAGDGVTPAFPVMCSNCGHTTFINAVRAGLVPEPEDESE
jgi:hypothetical protein